LRSSSFPVLALAGVGLALAAGAAGCGGRPEPRERDVVLVTVDTLRADRLGAYGLRTARTPHIDGLARAGTTFLQATTPFPRTTPALASLLTGLWPHHHGSREVGARMSVRPTLAEVLGRRGYATLAVSANQAAGPAQRLDLGFQRFVDRAALGSDRAERVTDRALGLVRELAAGVPLLLWVHYVDPHFPYEPPPGFRDQPPQDRCRSLSADMRTHRVRLAHVHNDRDGLARDALADCLAAYDGEVAYVDSEIGRLLAGLRGIGRLERALVVLTADHGENLGEDGLYYEHGPSVHDSSLRVPLIVVGGGPAGRVDSRAARLEDLMPTLLALLGEPRESTPRMDGVDLSARLRAPRLLESASAPLALAEAGSDLFVESHQQVRSGPPRGLCCLNAERFSLCEKPDWEWPRLFDRSSDAALRRDVSDSHRAQKRELMRARRLWPVGEARQRTARSAEYKLVERPRWRGGYERRLYALGSDPGESRDLSAALPEVVERLAAALDPWAGQVALAARERGEPPPEQEPLRALGYVQ
jgi:arylsulfatase